MNPIFKTVAFWKGVALLLAGVAALLVVFGVVPAQYGYGADAIFGAIYIILQFIGVKIEMSARGLL